LEKKTKNENFCTVVAATTNLLTLIFHTIHAEQKMQILLQ